MNERGPSADVFHIFVGVFVSFTPNVVLQVAVAARFPVMGKKHNRHVLSVVRQPASNGPSEGIDWTHERAPEQGDRPMSVPVGIVESTSKFGSIGVPIRVEMAGT
jgi:hypothetical protein